MTTSNEDIPQEVIDQAVDSISQDQNTLDQEQDTATPVGGTPVTMESMQAFFSQQLQPLQAQVYGLHNKVDTGLNAVRRDVSQEARRLVENVTDGLSRQQLLANVDEEQRPIFEALLQHVDNRTAPAQPVQEQPVQAQPASQDPWEGIYQYVERHGLSRSAPGINYAVLTNQSLTEEQKGQAFNESLFQARLAQSQGQAGIQQPRPAQPVSSNGQGTVNPPVERSGGLSQNPLRTQDQVTDAFLAGQLNSPEDPDGAMEYKKRMAALG